MMRLWVLRGVEIVVRGLADFEQWPQWELGLGFMLEEKRKGDDSAEEVFGGA